MTKAGLDSLISTYKTILVEAGNPSSRGRYNQASIAIRNAGPLPLGFGTKIEPVLHRIGGFQEAIRLLGCIQGTVMACGLCTIAETREHANQAGMPTWQQILDEEK